MRLSGMNTRPKPAEVKPASGAKYGEYTPGPYAEEANRFLRQCLRQIWNEDTFRQAEQKKIFTTTPYVTARLFLSSDDWNRYLWILHHGSLEGCAL